MKIHPILSHINKEISALEILLTQFEDYETLLLYLNELNDLKLKLPTYRVFTKPELLYDYNGHNGNPLYLATCNYVFDVTNHPMWYSRIYPALQLGLCPLDYFNLYYQNDLRTAAQAGPIVGKLVTP